MKLPSGVQSAWFSRRKSSLVIWRGFDAVAADRPDIVAAAAVGGEGDLAARRASSAAACPRRGRWQMARASPPVDRHDVKVAEQVERDLAPVGRDVERHPGAACACRWRRRGPGRGGALTSHLSSFLPSVPGAGAMPGGCVLGHRLGLARLGRRRRDRRGRRLGEWRRGASSEQPTRSERWRMMKTPTVWKSARDFGGADGAMATRRAAVRRIDETFGAAARARAMSEARPETASRPPVARPAQPAFRRGRAAPGRRHPLQRRRKDQCRGIFDFRRLDPRRRRPQPRPLTAIR